MEADKLITKRDIFDGMADGPTLDYDEADGIVGAHQVRFNGVAPTRQNVINCKYEFWASQHFYYQTVPWSSAPMNYLLGSLKRLAARADYVTAWFRHGLSADFWAPASEMTKCGKVKVSGVTKKIINYVVSATSCSRN